MLTCKIFSMNRCSKSMLRYSRLLFSTGTNISTSTNTPTHILPYISKAARLIGKSLTYPQIGVFGQQSSGKTSTIEALVGMDIFYKSHGMATRRPLDITTIRTKEGAWVEFSNGDKLFDQEKIRKR